MGCSVFREANNSSSQQLPQRTSSVLQMRQPTHDIASTMRKLVREVRGEDEVKQ